VLASRPGSITLRSLSVEKLIRHVVRTGRNAIELDGDVHVPHGDPDTSRRVAKQTSDGGLAVALYGSYYKFQVIFCGTGPDWNSVLGTADTIGAPALRRCEVDPSVKTTQRGYY